jgi:small-conductance mechanosensitive channel
MVARQPAPQVLFRNFGESSLEFELRVWVLDVDEMLTTYSDLLQEIDRRFRQANIEIAFPQLDLHVRSDHTKQVQRSAEAGATLRQGGGQ